LLERDLIKILGKKDEPGRPMLYGTTPFFLELFSMQSLRDLPTLKEFTELSEESRATFEREIGEDAPETLADLEPAPSRVGAKTSEPRPPSAPQSDLFPAYDRAQETADAEAADERPSTPVSSRETEPPSDDDETSDLDDGEDSASELDERDDAEPGLDDEDEGDEDEDDEDDDE
jgi:segregation and condensation protein B